MAKAKTVAPIVVMLSNATTEALSTVMVGSLDFELSVNALVPLMAADYVTAATNTADDFALGKSIREHFASFNFGGDVSKFAKVVVAEIRGTKLTSGKVFKFANFSGYIPAYKALPKVASSRNKATPTPTPTGEQTEVPEGESTHEPCNANAVAGVLESFAMLYRTEAAYIRAVGNIAKQAWKDATDRKLAASQATSAVVSE